MRLLCPYRLRPHCRIVEPKLSRVKLLEDQSYANGTRQKLSSVQSFTVSVNDKDLERVYKFKYLGVILNPCLTWTEHIEHIGNKISSRLGMIHRARKVILKEACITLLNAMVLPFFLLLPLCVRWLRTGKQELP